MHEWSLAEAVIETAIDFARKNGLKKITKIKIRMGELQQIEEDIFRYAINEILNIKGDIVKDTEIEIEEEKVLLKCRVCGYEWGGEEIFGTMGEGDREAIHFLPEVAHTYTRCPMCKSTDFKVIKGRGLFIDSITGEKS